LQEPARNLNKREKKLQQHTHIVHDALSWTVCYDNMCWTHMSSKDKAEWYSQKLKKKQNSYNTTGQLKRLAILKKAEIKETDTHRTQVEEDYSDSTWIALNLNANSKMSTTEKSTWDSKQDMSTLRISAERCVNNC
jgi:hypothetical protein